ncbi:diguanylate cyclase [Psychromonas sp.]|nr:diguanylate cyclase [Psychromonas sp.]
MHKNKLVLIVDDSPTNLKILASCLKNAHQLKIATNGEQCLAIAQLHPQPDLILLDVEMPDMNGYEVCEKLKNSPDTASIPVIFVTGLQGEKDEERGLSLGAVDYITKPIRPAIVIARVKTHLTIKTQQDKLNKMAFHDHLTNLYNRHFLMDVANQKIARAKRHHYDLWLLMIDIDHFKVVNDTHGHAVGDIVLKAVADTLIHENRNEDLAARFGGEEFVVVFDPCKDEDAFNKAIRILDSIENLHPNGVKVTVSIGMAKLVDENENFEQLLKRADHALYQAKKNGRNRIEMAH